MPRVRLGNFEMKLGKFEIYAIVSIILTILFAIILVFSGLSDPIKVMIAGDTATQLRNAVTGLYAMIINAYFAKRTKDKAKPITTEEPFLFPKYTVRAVLAIITFGFFTFAVFAYWYHWEVALSFTPLLTTIVTFLVMDAMI